MADRIDGVATTMVFVSGAVGGALKGMLIECSSFRRSVRVAAVLARDSHGFSS
jgi:hypothetical protein